MAADGVDGRCKVVVVGLGLLLSVERRLAQNEVARFLAARDRPALPVRASFEEPEEGDDEVRLGRALNGEGRGVFAMGY